MDLTNTMEKNTSPWLSTDAVRRLMYLPTVSVTACRRALLVGVSLLYVKKHLSGVKYALICYFNVGYPESSLR